MKEQFRMTHDIVDDHGARMQNMMKYYPFFVLAETTFTQYQDGRYSQLDVIMEVFPNFFPVLGPNAMSITFEDHTALRSEQVWFLAMAERPLGEHLF